MSYITEAFRILPIAIIIAGIAYCILFALAKKKRKRPYFLKIVTEYILVGWLVMFFYVTQVMSFGQGMGEMINLIPLSPFFTAVEYGLNHAGRQAPRLRVGDARSIQNLLHHWRRSTLRQRMAGW